MLCIDTCRVSSAACLPWQPSNMTSSLGVGVASRPKARLNCDGFTIEITRVATNGARNACSRIYGSLCRAAAAVGYRRAITFTRLDEPGSSLRASGFVDTGITREQSWDRPLRGRFSSNVRSSSVRRWERRLRPKNTSGGTW